VRRQRTPSGRVPFESSAEAPPLMSTRADPRPYRDPRSGRLRKRPTGVPSTERLPALPTEPASTWGVLEDAAVSDSTRSPRVDAPEPEAEPLDPDEAAELLDAMLRRAG